MIVPPGGLNDSALAIRLRKTWTSRPSMPLTTSLPRFVARRGAFASCRRGRSQLLDVDQHRQHQAAQVDRLRFGARQLGVEPRGVGDVADQPVEALHVVLDDAHQLALLVGVLDPRDGLDRAAQRGQRVLDLVGDVGGEALDRVHALPQRLGHLAQRARQLADLVVRRRSPAGMSRCGCGRGARRRRPRPGGGSAARWCRRGRATAARSPPRRRRRP